MSDTINLTDPLAGFSLASILERFERTEDNDSEQAEDVARPGRRRGREQLRAAFARERQRPRPAFLLELSQRARQAAGTRETEAAAEPEQGAEAAPRGRAALRQQFQQTMQTFRGANQPGRAAGAGGEEQRGVATIPVGLERGARQGGGAAAGAAEAPAAAGTRERPGSQAGTQPTIIANREPPRLDGIRMAASFEFTALGNALKMSQGPVNANIDTGPANPAAQGLAVGGEATPTARPGTMGETLQAAGGNTAPGRQGFGAGATPIRQGGMGGNRPEQSPLGQVQRRQENPGSNLLNTDQRSPLAADRIALAPGRIGNTQLEQRPLVGRMNPGGPEEADNELRAGVRNETINRATGMADRANAAPERIMTDDRAGLRQDIQTGGGPVGATQAAIPPQQAAIPANRLAGAPLEGPGGGIGENVRPAAAPAPGVAPPANPLEPEAPNLLVNESAAPLDGNPGQVVPRLADVQGAGAPEPGQPAANPAPPAPEPTETPAEQAAAIRATPAEVADAELRATIPTPIEPPPGAAARETPAAPPGPAEANPAVARPAAGAAGQVGRPEGAPETPPVSRAGVPAEAGAEEENGPGMVPPEAAPPGAAEGRPVGAGPAENPTNEAGPLAPPGEETEEFEQLQARAVTAYELQQMENRTNEPNEGRTVTEMFIR